MKNAPCAAGLLAVVDGFLLRLLARELFCFEPGRYPLNAQSLLNDLPSVNEIEVYLIKGESVRPERLGDLGHAPADAHGPAPFEGMRE